MPEDYGAKGLMALHTFARDRPSESGMPMQHTKWGDGCGEGRAIAQGARPKNKGNPEG